MKASMLLSDNVSLVQGFAIPVLAVEVILVHDILYVSRSADSRKSPDD